MLYIVGATGKLGSGLLSFLKEAVAVKRSLRELDSLSAGDVVVNAAGRVGGSCEELEEANVELPQRLLETAEDRGAFLVHISSIAVYGDRDFGDSFDPYSDEELKAKDCYGVSKLKGERRVKGRAAVLRLGPVFGGTFPSYAKMLRLLKKGWVPLIGRGHNHIPLTYIGDVAQAVKALAEKKKAVLEVLAGPGAKQREIYEEASRLLGVSPRYIPIPRWLAGAVAKPLGFREHVKVLSRHRPFPPPRLIKPTPFREGLKRTVEEFKKKGWV